MESLDISGKTVEEAIQRALEQLGVSREEVKVTIVKEGRHGVLGMGAEEAMVRVTSLLPASKEKADMAEIARTVVEALLIKLGVVASIVPYVPLFSGEGDEASTSIAFDIRSDDLGILIGWHGQTLSSLQYILKLIVAKQTGTWPSVSIDVGGYKQRRGEALQALAWRMAGQVEVKGEPFALEPMPAYERRIVHLTLVDHPDVTTHSVGEGEARKVVIEPQD
ncbi:RNA-binding cell elongation regulator Jag/EloR [Chloroflexota bacterium]